LKLTFEDGIFICRCSFQDRLKPRDAGFSWHPEKKIWYTNRIQVAALLRDHADHSARKKIRALLIEVKPWHGPLLYPPTEKLKGFQASAARFILSRNRSYGALDPGLGKGVIAVVVANTIAFHHETNCLPPPVFVYICPPFLLLNVEEEWKTWRTFSGMIQRYEYALHPDARVLIFPDSKMQLDEHRFELEAFIECAKRAGRRVVAFVDEAHRYKTPDAQRTKMLLGFPAIDKDTPGIPSLVRHFNMLTYLSGTPMPNRPMELFTILNKSAPETIDFANQFEYGKKYCAGFEDTHGWDFSGASNLDELREKVHGKFMIRMKKSEVLKELPPKIEEFLFVGETAGSRVTEMESAMLKEHSPEDIMRKQIALVEGKDRAEELNLATYRRLLGREKVNPAVEAINEILLGSDEAIIVTAYHTDVIEALALKLAKWKPLVIYGKMKGSGQTLVDIFQKSAEHRLFIIQIDMAVGYTMTKATRVMHVEPSYVPATNDQASDRAHRIGQLDSVFVQYLVYRNSLDRMILSIVLRKKNVTAQI